MRNKIILALVAGITPLVGQTVWTDGSGGDPSWSNTANWSTAVVPVSTTNVQISTQPSVGLIGIDTGATIIASLTIDSGITSFSFESALGDTLQVGSITNNSGQNITFNLPVFAGAATQTWTGPLAFNNIVDISTRSVTLAGASDFNGSDLTFAINNATTFGRFLGTGTADVTGVTINIGTSLANGFSFAGGQSFDFTTGSFAGATLNVASLPVLTGGLTWNTSQFLSSGILTVVSAVPEPSTCALMIGSIALGAVALRRRRTQV